MIELSRPSRRVLDIFRALDRAGLPKQLAGVICTLVEEVLPLRLEPPQADATEQELIEKLVELRCRAEIKNALLSIAEELHLSP